MGLSRTLDTDIWTHHGIADLGPIAKLVYLYLCVNPHSDKCGCVRLSPRVASFILGITQDQWAAALGELAKIVREFDGLLAIRGWIEHNCKNASWKDAALACLQGHPPVVRDWVQGTPTLPPPYPQAGGSEVVSGSVAVEEQDQKQEQDLPLVGVPTTSSSAAAVDPAPKVPDCPQQAILDLYHRILPELPRMRTWGPDRQANLRSRWREDPKRQTLEAWEQFFTWIRESDFLMGKADADNDRPVFLASLDWLIRPRNWAKLLDGKYHRKQETPLMSIHGRRTMEAAKRVLSGEPTLIEWGNGDE